MASVNKVILVGNLGADPDMNSFQNGDKVANLRVATTDSWKDKNGQKQEKTEWHRVVFFGKLADICEQYLKKGSSIYVEGSLTTRKWQDKDGKDVYTTEIRGGSLQMLGGRQNASDTDNGGQSQPRQQTNQNQSAPRQAAPAGGNGNPDFDDFSDDIPFTTSSLSADTTIKKLSRTDLIKSRF